MVIYWFNFLYHYILDLLNWILFIVLNIYQKVISFKIHELDDLTNDISTDEEAQENEITNVLFENGEDQGKII